MPPIASALKSCWVNVASSRSSNFVLAQIKNSRGALRLPGCQFKPDLLGDREVLLLVEDPAARSVIERGIRSVERDPLLAGVAVGVKRDVAEHSAPGGVLANDRRADSFAERREVCRCADIGVDGLQKNRCAGVRQSAICARSRVVLGLVG